MTSSEAYDALVETIREELRAEVKEELIATLTKYREGLSEDHGQHYLDGIDDSIITLEQA